MGAPYNSVTNVTAKLLVSPNVYLPGFPSFPEPGPLDFYVENGSSFRPTEWMLERPGPLYVASMYWVLEITHTSFWDLIYRQQINPPLDIGPVPGTADVWRTYQSHAETYTFNAGRIANNCPPMLSPQDGYDSYGHPMHIKDNHTIAATFYFAFLFNHTLTNVTECSVQFVGSTDCPEALFPPEGGTAVQPTLTTRPNKVTVGLGTTFHDVAYLSGGNKPTGNITFRLYRNDSLIVREDIVNVSGNGYYASPDADTNIYGPGQYRYTAHYSGDIRNKSADTTINDPDEQVIIVGAGDVVYVPTMLNTTKYSYIDVPTMLNVSPVRPGISRNPQSGAARTWYRRTHP